MHLGGARVVQHLNQRAHRVAANDPVVHDHQPLPGDLVERVELEPDPLTAELLVGLDERPADIAVLDEPLLVRAAGSASRSRSPPVCRSRGSASRGRRPPGASSASRSPIRTRAAWTLAPPSFESGRAKYTCSKMHAALRPLGTACAEWQPSSSTQTTSPGRTSRTMSAPTRSSAHVSEATTQSSPMLTERERPDPERVAERDERPVRDRDDRVRALEAAHRARDGLVQRRWVAAEEGGDDLGVRGGADADSRGEKLVA